MSTATAKPTLPPEPFFTNGDDRVARTEGPIVAMAVSCNFVLRNGHDDPSRGHAIVLHEVPLMRRLYASGTIELIGQWVPAVSRLRKLTARTFDEELTRLRRSYRIPKQDLLAEVYGVTEADQKRKLADGMREIFEAFKGIWKRCQEEAIQRIGQEKWAELAQVYREIEANRHVTAQDLENLVRLVEPMSTGLEAVTLDALDIELPKAAGVDAPIRSGEEAPVAPAAKPTGDAPPQGDKPPERPMEPLVAALVEAGVDVTSARELHALHAEFGASIPDAMLAAVAFLRKTDGTLHLKRVKTVGAVLAKFPKPA